MVKLTEEQKRAMEIMQSGENIFLSGRAGTGKSFLIDQFKIKNKKKNILTFASTGIAAVNIGGVTVHRGFKLSAGFHKPTKSLKKSEPPRSIIAADIIIIDECSMLRIDLFEAMIRKIKVANQHRKSKRKKPIQLILVGDFFQLPPVVSSSDSQAMKHYYGNKVFAFESTYWKSMKFIPIVLQNVQRQSDQAFIDALNEVRLGDASGIDHINLFSNPSFLDGGIILTGLNAEASEINMNELAKINENSKIYSLVKSGSVKPSELNIDSELQLKINARVMFMINTNEYKNGELGTVISMDDEKVKVKKDNGEIVEVSWGFWKIHDYKVVEKESTRNGKKVKIQQVEEVEVGMYKQIPLKLAYAITIHKSQGQTFDRVNLMPYAWDHGQEYVALSRARSLQGLHLMSHIEPSYIRVNDKVKKFYGDCEKKQKCFKSTK